jgi:endonuclease III related protein
MKTMIRPSARSAYRLRRMYEKLVAAYGPQAWWPAATAFEVVIGAYLTQNTSWRSVEKSILNLMAHGSLSVEGIRNLSSEALRDLIRPSGYMVRKAAGIKAFVSFLDEQYGGSLELLAAEATGVAREKLLALPGVGPETADAILLYALGQPAMVVDEYLRRVVARHRLLHEGANDSEIQALAVHSLSSEKAETLVPHYNEFHALIVMVGKLHCGTKPKCDGCPLEQFLPRARVGTSSTLARLAAR